MSKSKGEFLTVSLLEEKGYNPLAYRMFCLQSHYRKPLEFSFETLDNVVTAYDKLIKNIGKLKDEGEVDKAVFDEYKEKFENALDNDLNTSMAITVVYEMLKADTNDKTKLELARSFEEVLSLNLTALVGTDDNGNDDDLEAHIMAMIEERAAAKKEKNFARADEIRDELLKEGIMIKDTREGVKWERI